MEAKQKNKINFKYTECCDSGEKISRSDSLHQNFDKKPLKQIDINEIKT